MKRLLAIILIVPLLLAGCAADDPWTDDVYLSTLYVWDGSTWNKITENGGTSAFAITWLGTFADAPVGPALNDAYRNSTDGIVYLWDGAAWQEMVEDGLPGPQGVQGPVGPAGAKGDKGDQGDPGSQGIQGEVGPAGAQGPQGLQGVAGADGADGISVTWLGTYASAPESPSLNDGYYNSTDKKSYIWDGDSWEIITQDGATGAQGPQGEQGPAGAQGEVGPQGPAGVDGVDGEDGAQGPQGEQGPAGPQGEQGPQGLQGIQGETGATGATGPEGPQGPQGIQGEQGIQGPAGEQGPQGIQGTAGEDGADGINGTDGVDGKTVLSGIGVPDNGLGTDGDFYINLSTSDLYGPKAAGAWGSPTSLIGPEGPEGEAGPAGDVGPAGDPGTDGKTWYFGTDAPNDLSGVDGDFYLRTSTSDVYTKAAGTWGISVNIKGATGDQGPQGEQGIQGPAGADGAPGADGADGYTPVKGVDYFDGADGADGYTPVKGVDYFDGEDGAPGLPGADGVDGISIEWLGSLAEAPGSPTLNQAYYDTVDKKSYVYDGDSWEILAQDGATGETGPAGADGEDGAPGPNEVTTSTATTGTGYLYGDGSFISFVDEPEGAGGEYSGVYFDSNNGDTIANGATGSPNKPLSDEAEALTVAGTWKVNKIYISGTWTQPSDLTAPLQFIGRDKEIDTFDANGKELVGSQLYNLKADNSTPDFAYLYNCINSIEGAYIAAYDCNDIAVMDTGYCDAYNNYFVEGGLNLEDKTAIGMLITKASGKLVIYNSTHADNFITIYAEAGMQIGIADNCTAGEINIYGSANVTNNTGGMTVNDYSIESQLDAIAAAIAAL